MYLTLMISTAYWRMSALRDAVVLPSKNEMVWKALACACARIDARESVGLLHAVVGMNFMLRMKKSYDMLICGCSRGECYWSSGPSSSQMQDDYIDYAVLDQCIVRAMELVPYKAFWQMGEPGYAPLKVSIALLAKLEPPLTAKNYLLHKLYLRQEYAECLKLIEDMLKEHQGLCEYPIYVKVALIMQHSGRIQESLQLFQAATCLNPDNKDNLKQVGRSLYLLGKHKAAIEVYEETKKLAGPEDWEI
ncbi:hypothetical protein DYB28_005572, partial [Aphanomyces astaci]